MTTRPTSKSVTPVTADIDRCSVVAVPLLLREADLVKLVAWADRRGMTTGQLLRQVVGLYLAADDSE